MPVITDQTGESSVVELTEENMATTPRHIEECGSLTGAFEEPLIRVMVFCNLAGMTFQAILLAETDDSFLVGGCVRMTVDENRQFSVNDFGYRGVQRWMKTSILYMVMPGRQVQYHYFNFMLGNGTLHLPDYWTDERMDHMHSFIEEYEEAGELSVPDSLANKEAVVASPTHVVNLDDGKDGPSLKDLTASMREVGASEHAFVTLTESKEIH